MHQWPNSHDDAGENCSEQVADHFRDCMGEEDDGYRQRPENNRRDDSPNSVPEKEVKVLYHSESPVFVGLVCLRSILAHFDTKVNHLTLAQYVLIIGPTWNISFKELFAL